MMKNVKKFGNNFSLISSIDRLDNGVIFYKKKEGDDEVGGLCVQNFNEKRWKMVKNRKNCKILKFYR